MNPQEILLVDDNTDAREALAHVLEHHGYAVRRAQNGAEALAEASLRPPDLMITDLVMPVLSGFDLLEQLRKVPELAEIPVIVVSAHHNTKERVAGLDLGADDFLAKPVNLDELLARVRRQLVRSDRERETVRRSIVDELTGVLNRRGLANFFIREYERVRVDALTVAVILVDLNDFKTVNDSRGHAVGDTVLCAIACALQDALRANDRVGRMGGDEFAIVLPDIRPEDCTGLAQRVRRISPVMIEFSSEPALHVGLSLGIASAQPGEAFEAVAARADIAMYEDKRLQKAATGLLR